MQPLWINEYDFQIFMKMVEIRRVFRNICENEFIALENASIFGKNK